MKLRIYTFTLIFGVVSAMAACGPQNKRRDPRKKPTNSATQGDNKPGGQDNRGADEIADALDLPHLADGQATFQQTCTSTISTSVTAAEKDITADMKQLAGSAYDLSDVKIFAHGTNKAGQAMYIAGQGKGPFKFSGTTPLDNVATVTCHNNTAATVVNNDMTVSIPLFINDPQETSGVSLAKFNLQGHKGKTGARVSLLQATKDTAPTPENIGKWPEASQFKVVLDNDSRVHMRLEMKESGPEGSYLIQYEAIYTKRP